MNELLPIELKAKAKAKAKTKLLSCLFPSLEQERSLNPSLQELFSTHLKLASFAASFALSCYYSSLAVRVHTTSLVVIGCGVTNWQVA